jgi:hypothetical protein
MTPNKYTELWNFLGSWFPDADLEGFDDDAGVVRRFVEVGNKAEIEVARRQLDELLRSDSIPFDRVAEEANRHFDTTQECRQWLETVAQYLAGQ